MIVGSRRDNTLDVSDLQSVRNFAQTITKCDIVLACAAEITKEGKQSVDGFDATFATNQLGTQALLRELMPLAPERVVIVASKLERSGLVDPDVVLLSKGTRLNNREGNFSAVKHYGDTKLCNQH